MSPEVVKEILEGAAQVVGEVLGKQVTRGELTEAFNKVAPKPNWKEPISAIVSIENDRELLMIREAVIFFTGSVPKFVALPGGKMPGCKYRVNAAGYYKTIGA